MPFREDTFHLSLRMSHCGQAALALAAPRELAWLAFPGSTNQLGVSLKVDEMSSAALLLAGAQLTELDPGLSLPVGLDALDWTCPRMGHFTPKPGFGIVEGVSTARRALELLKPKLPQGFCAQALEFGYSFGDSIYFTLAPRIAELMARAKAQSERHRMAMALGAPPLCEGSPARL